jgi:hypothetical protein
MLRFTLNWQRWRNIWSRTSASHTSSSAIHCEKALLTLSLLVVRDSRRRLAKVHVRLARIKFSHHAPRDDEAGDS